MFISNAKKLLVDFVLTDDFVNIIFYYRKEEPIGNTLSASFARTTPAKNVYETPPQMIASSEQPPPLTRGKCFRPSTDDEAESPSFSVNRKSESTNQQHSLNELCDIALNSDSNASVPLSLADKKPVVEISRKRPVRIEEPMSPMSPMSPIKRTKSSSSECKRLEYFEKSFDTPSKSTSTCTSTSSRDQCDPKQSTSAATSLKCYTELRYLEAIGSIRTIRRSKHPGINKLPTSFTHSEMITTTTPLISPESQNGWDRKTKLKLSYRIGNTANDIQFALIIYEPLTMVTRRNLLEEFQLAAEDEANRNRSIKNTHPRSNKTKSKTTPMKSDKLMSLRRLRF